MPDNELSKEVKEQLEIARSKVRRVLTYGAAGLFIVLVLWGTMWMGDRSAMMVGIQAALAFMFYWFGQRSVKPPEIK
ncbi:hypothetical protein ES703_00331 [subsurface metagenome]